MTISSGKVVNKPEVVIDPQFFLPPNVVDMRYKNDSDFDGTEVNAPARYTSPETEGEFDNVVSNPDDTNPNFPSEPIDESLPIPANISLVSQTTHLGPGGAVLVDIVLEIPDMPGVTDVDVRVSRIL